MLVSVCSGHGLSLLCHGCKRVDVAETRIFRRVLRAFRWSFIVR